MIDRGPSPGNIKASKLVLTTSGTCDLDPGHLLEVFDGQRERFITVLQRFGPADWAAPTRCADWSAHEVVRHLCDGSAITAIAGPDDRTLDMSDGFDPRVTPRGWLAESADESPDVTLRRFMATTAETLAVLRTRLAQNRRFDVWLPYGPMDWTILALHLHWDSWLHERDVLLASGREHLTDDNATFYATAYGLFIAAVVAWIFGDPLRQRLTLCGDGGGIFHLDNSGAVTLTASQGRAAGPRAADVADALAGRSEPASVLGGLPCGSRTALSHLAEFFNTPLDQHPA